MSTSSQLVGQMLGHYRIVEQIGAGGMGVVYLGHDDQLDRDVAIKVLPVGAVADEPARKRFRREALALGKLNHPNIAMVFEFGAQGVIDYLITEYVSGQTLDSKLDSGALSESEVIGLGIQLAEGLNAAHQHAIVHRDLKPGNLRLTKEGRLKILDFGLAQLMPQASEVGRTVTLSRSQEVTGTLPYMAPEQLRGEPADARTDLWSAGAVLYELATGHRPFEEKIPTALAGDILHKAPPSPRMWNSGLSSLLEAVILKCLQKEPAKRYDSAAELKSELERISTGVIPVAARRLSLLPLIITSAAIVLVVAVASWYALKVSKTRSAGSAIRARRSVAVLGFKNLSGRTDESWLSTALSEMLTTELARSEQLRTVPGETVAQMKVSLALPQAEAYGVETLSRIQRSINADEVLSGSYLALGKDAGGKVHLDLRLQATSNGETTAVVVAEGTEDQLPEVVSRAGGELLSKLGIGGEARPGEAGVSASSRVDANRQYAEGLDKIRSFDLFAGKELLEKAVAADPSFAQAHTALSLAWDNLGYHQRAREEASRAVDLSGNLPREEKLVIKARYQETEDAWADAAETYRSLFTFFPDNIEYGLNLARAQAKAGKGHNALETVAALRQLPGFSGGDPRIDSAEAVAAESLGDFARMQQAADRAAKQAEAHGLRLLTARMLRSEGQAYERLGRQTEARAVWEKAKRIDQELGDKGELGLTLSALGIQLDETGDLRGAQSMQEQALAIFREIGNTGAVPAALIDLGNVMSHQGELAKAQQMYEEALPLCRQVGNRYCESSALGNIGNRMEEQGNLLGARVYYEQAIAIDRELGNQSALGLQLGNLAELLHLLGDLSGSEKLFQQVLEPARASGDRATVAFTQYKLAGVMLARGELGEARKQYQDAESIFKAIDDADDVANCHLSMAELEIEEGQLATAEQTARDAIRYFSEQKNSVGQLTGQGVLAEVLVAAGDSSGAQKALAPVLSAPRNPNRVQDVSIATVIARVEAGAGKPAEAARNLKVRLAETERMKCIAYALEQRLALAEIEIKSGHEVTGRARLQVLEKDAALRGFLLVARKARKASIT